ncbi:hypothetical protein BDW67DRAFT_187584 [Aspergillus spinulosporus]
MKLTKLTGVEAHHVTAKTLAESKRTGHMVEDVSLAVNTTSATATETGIKIKQIDAEITKLQSVMGTPTGAASEGHVQLPSTLVKHILPPSKTLGRDRYHEIDKA